MRERWSRRDVLRSVAASAGLGVLGSMAGVTQQARASTPDRKFLFFFAGGGWDATPLDPKYGPDGISAVSGTDMDLNTQLGQAGNLTWSSGPDRLAMDRYFLRWGRRSCLVRGVNVHSAGHESGMKWMMTGTSASSVPDWPSILAARGVADYPMPYLVFGGPAYPGPFGAAVVRGGGGALLELLDGSINARADRPAPVVPTPMDAMMDAFVHDRAARLEVAHDGLARQRLADLRGNVARANELEGRRFEAGLDQVGRGLVDQALLSVEVMRLGLSRCAMVSIPGGWDTHGGNQRVGAQLDTFFAALSDVMDHLATTPGTNQRWLIDEVTIVVTSELGRTPKFNGSMGRDHWPYTSMMLAGGGIQGDTVVGATDEGFVSMPVDLATGRAAAGGVTLGTEHVGVSLLELGGVDPAEFLPGVPGVSAVRRM
jgi:uncharacterized protein (DUF1501 family)